MKRFDDWPAQLDIFVTSRRQMPFEWGNNDCCLFACDAVMAMTGTDLARGFRGRYTTQLSAMKAMKKRAASVGALADLVAKRHKLREVPPLFAQRGDIVLLERDFGESLGIVSLHGTDIWAPAEDGLAEVSIHEGQRAWRI